MACKRKHNYLPIPIWSLCLYKNWVLISGGGGGKKFGVKNMLMIYKPYTMELLKEEDTEEELLSSITTLPKKDILVAAITKDIQLFKITDDLKLIKLVRVSCEQTKNLGMVRGNSVETMLISGGEEGYLRVWKVQSEKSLQKSLDINTFSEITCCDISLQFICAALKNKTCALYSVETGLKLKSLQFGENISAPLMVKSCYFSGSYLMTLETGVRSASYLSKWKLLPEVFPIDSVKICKGSASYLKLSRSGRYAGVGSSDGSVSIIDTNNLKILHHRLEFDMPATCLDFNNKENVMLVGSADYAYSYIHFKSTSWLAFLLLGLALSFLSYSMINS